MYHDKALLLKIERWMRLLAWYYLAAFALGALMWLYSSNVVLTNPEVYDPFPGAFARYEGINDLLIKLRVIFGSAKGMLGHLFTFLVLQGTSRGIRSLLAVHEMLLARYRRQGTKDAFS